MDVQKSNSMIPVFGHMTHNLALNVSKKVQKAAKPNMRTYPLQVIFQDYARTFQACLCQPITTQPEALGVDWHHRRV